MWQAIKAMAYSLWDRIKAFFLRSETILWARLQVIVGAVWTALSATDLAPLLNPKWLTYWLIFNGVVTELLRRRNDPTLGK